MKHDAKTGGQANGRSYRAFLSYSHADEQAARKLHRWLETYRIPARLVGTDTRAGPVPARLAPIFRDRNELPAATSLGEEVRQALAQSEALLVLCSPAARASRWVEAEIALFRTLHPDRPVLAALIDGEPQDSFPAALTAIGPSGEPLEPIAADFRPDHDGTKLARFKIVAGLTGLALDQIIQRDAQRQLRRVIAVTFLATVLTLSMALMLLFAVRARTEAENQRRQAEGLIEFMLTDLRQRLEGVGRLDVLNSVNKRALAYYSEQSDLSDLPVESLERRARILHAMGEDDHAAGNYPSALAKFNEAHRVTGTLLAADPDDPQRIFAHAQSEFWLGYVDYMASNREAALRRFLAYRTLAEQLLEAAPDNVAYRRELAYAQGNICTVTIAMKETARGFEACTRALATMQRVKELAPGDASVDADLANRHAWVADALQQQGKLGRAFAERQKEADLIRDLMNRDPKNTTYLEAWMLSRYSMAQLLHEMGSEAEAQNLKKEALGDVSRLISADPQNNDWRLWRDKFIKPFGG